jgi:hypothetical protein
VSPARTAEDEFAATITAGASKDGFDSGLPNELLGTTPQLFGTEDLKRLFYEWHGSTSSLAKINEKFKRNIDLTKRTLFVTCDGHIGIGSPKVRAGDELCMIFGGGTAMDVIRLLSGKYQLVGACYFHGYMNGEAMLELEPAGNLKEEWIELI